MSEEGAGHLSEEHLVANGQGVVSFKRRRLSTIWKPRLPPHVCRCWIGALSISGDRGDLPSGHKCDQRFDESGPLRSFEANYFSGLQEFRQEDGAPSWKRPGVSFWLRYAASQSRNGRATCTQPSSWLGNSAAFRWTKMSYGLRRRRWLLAQRW